jgi:hypothetical protein
MNLQTGPAEAGRGFRSICIDILLVASLLGNGRVNPGTTDEFAVSKIPLELMQQANGIVRQNRSSFVVESAGKATEQVFTAVTIFNQNGREFGCFAIPYDRYRKIKSLRAFISDAEGKKIRDANTCDMQDRSAISDYSLYDDDRIRVVKLEHDIYPYTVSLEYKMEHNGLVAWPTWYPQLDNDLPVENASFELTAPNSMDARFRLRGGMGEPESSRDSKSKTFCWKIRSIPMCETEPYGYGWHEQAPAVMTAPSVFQFDMHQGDMSSWGSFANWYGELNEKRQILPDSAISQIQQICSGIVDTREKVRKLYEHLQATTRFVSIQLGIGSWQPFDAAFVNRQGYGDCKALVNYMRAMLTAVNISSYPALISRGDDAPEILQDFPSNQFNHVVLFVPTPGDTLWLECTSQTSLCGHLGVDDEDRYALVVLPGEGRLFRTPRSKSKDNMQVSRVQVQVLNELGDALADVKVRYTGNQQDRVRNALVSRSGKERKDWLRDKIDVSNFDIQNSDFRGVDVKGQEVELRYGMKMNRCFNKTGSSFLFQPNLLQRWRTVPKAVKKRTQPVNLGYAFVDLDSVNIQVPARWNLETSFPEAKFETSFGCYHASAEIRGGMIYYVRRMEYKTNKLPAAMYEEFRSFIEKVVKADRMMMAFTSKGI